MESLRWFAYVNDVGGNVSSWAVLCQLINVLIPVVVLVSHLAGERCAILGLLCFCLSNFAMTEIGIIVYWQWVFCGDDGGGGKICPNGLPFVGISMSTYL